MIVMDSVGFENENGERVIEEGKRTTLPSAEEI